MTTLDELFSPSLPVQKPQQKPPVDTSSSIDIESLFAPSNPQSQPVKPVQKDSILQLYSNPPMSPTGPMQHQSTSKPNSGPNYDFQLPSRPVAPVGYNNNNRMMGGYQGNYQNNNNNNMMMGGYQSSHQPRNNFYI
jgi:hypothetical protein